MKTPTQKIQKENFEDFRKTYEESLLSKIVTGLPYTISLTLVILLGFKTYDLRYYLYTMMFYVFIYTYVLIEYRKYKTKMLELYLKK